jgi:hypothetical protein
MSLYMILYNLFLCLNFKAFLHFLFIGGTVSRRGNMALEEWYIFYQCFEDSRSWNTARGKEHGGY